MNTRDRNLEIKKEKEDLDIERIVRERINFKTEKAREGKHSQCDLFFENLPTILRAEAVASLLSISIATIYDWRYRAKQKGVPGDLFLKFNRGLYLKTEVLKRWIISQNSSI